MRFFNFNGVDPRLLQLLMQSLHLFVLLEQIVFQKLRLGLTLLQFRLSLLKLDIFLAQHSLKPLILRCKFCLPDLILFAFFGEGSC